ncbi:hypothetical protein cypCar_00027768, partial [Cyprinus carpio]
LAGDADDGTSFPSCSWRAASGNGILDSTYPVDVIKSRPQADGVGEANRCSSPGLLGGPLEDQDYTAHRTPPDSALHSCLGSRLRSWTPGELGLALARSTAPCGSLTDEGLSTDQRATWHTLQARVAERKYWDTDSDSPR